MHYRAEDADSLVFPDLRSFKSTQKELCQKCSIIDTTYSSWKNRNRLPSIDDIQKLSEHLHVSIEWLINGTEPHTQQTPEDKQQLLDYYDQCNQEGKNRIMEQAEFIASKYPQQGKSSEYKIG